MRIVDNAPWLGSLQISSFVELFWILQQWKLGDNSVSRLLEHQHTNKTLALLHNNQSTRRRSLDERVNDKVGGIIEPEGALAGARHCAPRKRKKLQNYKSPLSISK